MISRTLRSNELLLGQAEVILRLRATCCVSVLAPCVAAPLDDVGGRGGEDAPDVDAEVLVELGVLGRDDRVAQQRVDVVVADDHAPLRRELADHLAARRVDARDRARRVVVERRDCGRSPAYANMTPLRTPSIAATMKSATMPALRAIRTTTCVTVASKF